MLTRWQARSALDSKVKEAWQQSQVQSAFSVLGMIGMFQAKLLTLWL
jgi:hypothetical protein